MNERVVKHRNYTFLYFLMVVFCVLAFMGGLTYFNASMDHTTILEKGISFVYKHIMELISSIF